MIVDRQVEQRPWTSLGKRVAELRHARHLSQKEYARLVPMSSGYLTRVETGRNRPDPAILRRMAAVLGVPYEDLAVLAEYMDAGAREVVDVPVEKVSVVRRLLRFSTDQLERLERGADAIFSEPVERDPGDPPSHPRRQPDQGNGGQA